MEEQPLTYKLITGKDDVNFCKRVSKLIAKGYTLYGSPSLTFNGTDVITAQALIYSKLSF